MVVVSIGGVTGRNKVENMIGEYPHIGCNSKAKLKESYTQVGLFSGVQA